MAFGYEYNPNGLGRLLQVRGFADNMLSAGSSIWWEGVVSGYEDPNDMTADFARVLKSLGFRVQYIDFQMWSDVTEGYYTYKVRVQVITPTAYAQPDDAFGAIYSLASDEWGTGPTDAAGQVLSNPPVAPQQPPQQQQPQPPKNPNDNKSFDWSKYAVPVLIGIGAAILLKKR